PKQDGLLTARLVAFRHEPRQERRIILDHPGFAPDLDPLAARVIHQEEERLRVLAQVAEGNELAIAAKIRECNRLLVQDVEEARRPTAMLDVGLAGTVCGAKKDAGLLGDEVTKLYRNGRFPAATHLHPGIG